MFIAINYFRPDGGGRGMTEIIALYKTEIREVPEDTNLRALRDEIHESGEFCPFPREDRYAWLKIRKWDKVEKIETELGTMVVLSIDEPEAEGECDTEVLFSTHVLENDEMIRREVRRCSDQGFLMQDSHCFRRGVMKRVALLEGLQERPKTDFPTAYGPRDVVFPEDLPIFQD